ncbi:MAG: glycosyltransferase family 4 protein [Pyrinomonadaceae bacterium]|nr:glycosyltransferase family 4 protein [Pyrinomonadaceae bacterium]MBP6214040.1 glycosyltransferase family 4 protein [Pyrinomonadaceae bacterium]
MKVLALVPSQRGYSPGQRGSIELWESVLRADGIELVFAPFETERLQQILYTRGNQVGKALEMLRGYADRIKLLQKLDDFDAVFVYREAALFGPAFLEKLVARKKPIIYQLDDPLFMPYRSPANGYLSYLKFFGKIKEIIRISKAVIVNSSHIRDYALQFNRNVWQVPSVVDTDKFVYQPRTDENARVCVGWSGSPTTLQNIKMIERPLQQISEKAICDIHLIGGTEFGIENVRYTAQKWNLDTEVDDLRKMQIGLVPLPDNSWNRYKFIMKTAQYMALGIVPVGTPMASNPEVIRHGENGFLADSDKEWVEYVSLLVQDGNLRRNLSEAAAIDARERYSLAANTSKIIEAFRSAVTPPPKKANG